ncbi:hypothetical protein EW145_g545 [Phellinidium pouzarii]|uniref:Conserved oligomeric Golgi complex subunit 1 n=1 Tax=Phellinidium pouzarii TaxID=167371 RepID=A0A4S4LIK6_9AGAM|nr:hypothetical protein EW145_g545 [Phellinidium pouzarii]
MSKLLQSSAAHSFNTHDNLKSSDSNLRRRQTIYDGSSWPSHTVSASSSGQGNGEGMQLPDPDEVFARHTVAEVKTILYKLKSDVDAKQEELRLMVGERYRDLLQASTSIISMSQSSKRVFDSVINMKRTVTMDHPQDTVNGLSSRIEDDQLQVLQCLAAHLKLLLDASEHLWRLLERKRYLHAAWLFLLSRVVYRSLINESSEGGQDWVQQGIHVKEQFPLAQRQWESVSQFRVQISHKATLFLREQMLSSQELCASLLSLHLLDSLPLSDALDVFLKQRSRTIEIQYEAINGIWDSSPEFPIKEVERTGKKTVRSVRDALQSILDVLAVTVGAARQVFLEGADGSPSMVGKVLAFTPSDVPVSSIPPELCLSTQALLSSLPNSNYFLSLPPDIRSYRPFIDLKSTSSTVVQPVIKTKLKDWFMKAASHLKESAGSWLTRLETIKKVFEVRTSTFEWLSASNALLDKEYIEHIRILVDNMCKARVEVIWKTILERLATSFDKTLRSLTSDIAEKREGSELDISPAEFLLSAPPTPSVSQASLGISIAHSSFQRFKHAIKQHVDSMTPFIDKIITDAESITLDLRDDLDYAFADEESKHDLEAEYILHSEKTAGQLLSSLQELLDEEKGESEQSVRRLVFLGRVTQKLSSSPLIANMRCSTSFSDKYHIQAERLYDFSVEKSASNVVLSAKDKLFHCLKDECHPIPIDNSSIPSNPSPYLIDALLSLIDSIQSYGLFKSHTQRSKVVKIILDRFTSIIATSLPISRCPVTVQLLWDLLFVKAVSDDWGTALTPLDKTVHLLDACSNLEADLRRSVTESIPRFRLLLSPLLASSKHMSSIKPPRYPPQEVNRQYTYRSSLDPVGVEQGSQSALSLVKPSARFGSLWVGSAASQ